MKKSTVILCMIFLSGCATLETRPSFFGIRMHSERAAKNFRVEGHEGKGYEFSYVDGAMDPETKAEGRIQWQGEFISSVVVTVKNESELDLPTDYEIDEFKLETDDGRVIELKKPTLILNKDFRVIAAKKEVSYHLGVPVSERLTKKNITKIICTFGADQVKVVLLPIPEIK